MRFYPHERLALFVDGPNFWESTKEMGLDPDFTKLKDFFAEKATLVGAYYFTPLDERSGDFTPIRPLVDWLKNHGWHLTTRDKDTDVDLAVAMLELAPSVDHIVLASGDSDFISAMVAIQRKGKRVTILSPMPNCSAELRCQASEFIDLADLRESLARVGAPKRKVQA